MKGVYCAIFLVVVLFAPKTFAEEQPNLVSQTEIVIRNNVSGIWFPMETAREILADVRELPLLRRQLTLFDQQLQLREQQINRTNEQMNREVEAREELMGEVERANRRAERAEERQSSWVRNPVLWFVIGSLSTIALVIAGAAILKSVQPSLTFSVSD